MPRSTQDLNFNGKVRQLLILDSAYQRTLTPVLTKSDYSTDLLNDCVSTVDNSSHSRSPRPAVESSAETTFLNMKAAVRFKLADPEGRVLLPLAQEPSDSGIDSDETDNERRDRRRARHNEESLDEESDVTVEIEMPVPWNFCAQHPNRSLAERSARVSPSLFEVELTASDEDDASVLELIIPYQQPRYKKLPTSSPLKAKIRAPKYLCWFLCCFRK